MNNIVSTAELTELTGSARAARQAEILQKTGIKYIVRVDGKIKTTWSAVNSALEAKDEHEEQPNLGFLE